MFFLSLSFYQLNNHLNAHCQQLDLVFSTNQIIHKCLWKRLIIINNADKLTYLSPESKFDQPSLI